MRFSEEGPHGLLTCVRGRGVSDCEVVLAEKVTFLLASVFMAEVDCFLDGSVDLGVFLFMPACRPRDASPRKIYSCTVEIGAAR